MGFGIIHIGSNLNETMVLDQESFGLPVKSAIAGAAVHFTG